MNNELKLLEKKLADAQQAVALLNEEITKVQGQIDQINVAEGDVDALATKQVTLAAKRDILAKRLELAGEAVRTLQGDVLIARKAELSAQVADVNARLEAAKKQSLAEIGKLIRGGGLNPHEQGIVNAVVLLHRAVVPLLIEAERLELRHRDAEARAAATIRQRVMAEGREAIKMQESVFAGAV